MLYGLNRSYGALAKRRQRVGSSFFLELEYRIVVMEDSLSRQQLANRVEEIIQQLAEPTIIEDENIRLVYPDLSETGKDALLYIHDYFTRLRGLSLKTLFTKELESLYEETQTAQGLLNRKESAYESAHESAFIGLANRLSSQRSSGVAYALLTQSDFSHIHRNFSKKVELVLASAQGKLSTLREIEIDALKATKEGQASLLGANEQYRKFGDEADRARETLSKSQAKIAEELSAFKDQLFKTTNEQLEDFYKLEAKGAEERLKSIEEPLRRISSKTVTDLNAREFEDEAISHNRQSYWWLVASACVLVLLILLGFWFNRQVEFTNTEQVGAAIEATAFRVLIFSLGTFALIFCTRTYASHRHNFVINRQRSNALKTFEMFANGSSDAQVKDAILLQAAQCVFSPQTSGYIRNEPDPTANTQVARILADLNRNQ